MIISSIIIDGLGTMAGGSDFNQFLTPAHKLKHPPKLKRVCHFQEHKPKNFRNHLTLIMQTDLGSYHERKNYLPFSTRFI
jgi:hypothetical protein